MAHFKSKYLMSYLIGQGLSGLIPSIVAIIQGIGGNPECVAPTAGANTTIAHYPEPRFSVSVFFIFLLVMVLLSWFAFVLLNHLKACQSERVTHKDDSEVENQLKAVTETVRSDSRSDKSSDELQLNSESYLNRSNDRNISRNAFAGLLLTQAYICALTNGVLPSIQSYSCLPYGNTAYHLTVTLSSMANPIACFIAFYMSASVIKKTLPAVVGVGTLCAVYIIVTAVMSPTPPLQDSTSGKSDAGLDSDKPSKVEYEIAKYLRSKLPPKKTTLLSHRVDYFIASKSIDLLMDSKWSKDDKRQKEALFTSRESVMTFMDQMLRHKFFHRAKTVVVKKDKKKKADNEESSCNEEQMKEKKKSKKESKESKDSKEVKETKDESKEKDEKEVETKKKEKKKIKLDMHLEQIFVDENEPYVWIYDPIPLRTWFIGAGLVLAAIAICLFPLWPRTVRNYVYYLSIAAAGLLFFIIGLAVLRLIMFTIVWVVTFGKHHFWMLPNLTEDVGFMESFWPLYKHDVKDNNKKDTKEKDTKKKKKEETAADATPLLVADDDKGIDNKESGSESASTVDSIAKSNSSNELNATNGVNGFEILDSKELEDDEEEEADE
ncbi:unnamed protein product [Medioppia subpectinata]|uniref:Translocation protein SEC62 n=1 Tax=Medioppia subpectinata TaxID=1979941 RepID=A0A7R9KE46_9ACAR|nr:unnamed protein product [Medioppia subpectinata]CAG2101637.1 unnamed protein product [Medioppia subpectinata]